jgi:hypothetical protein
VRPSVQTPLPSKQKRKEKKCILEDSNVFPAMVKILGQQMVKYKCSHR